MSRVSRLSLGVAVTLVVASTWYLIADRSPIGLDKRPDGVGRDVENGASANLGTEERTPSAQPNLDCETELENFGDSGFLKRVGYLQIRNYFRSLLEGGYSPLQRQIIAEMAGLRCVSSCYDHWSLDDETSVAAYTEYALPSVRSRHSPVARQDGIASVDVDDVDIEQLALAIQQDLPPQAFSALVDAATDLDATWRDRRTGRRINLAMFAATSLKPAHLRILVDRGVDPVSAKWSVLDDLAFKVVRSPDQVPAMDAVVAILLDAGDGPFWPKSVEALESKLPASRTPRLRSESLAAMAERPLEAPAGALASLVAEVAADVEAARSKEEQCGKQGRLPTVGQGLAAKMRFEAEKDTRNERLLQHALDLSEQRPVLSEDEVSRYEDLRRAVAQIWELADEGKWAEAIALADEWLPGFESAEVIEMMYGMLLSTALRDAPIVAIVPLIERSGGRLPDDAILEIVRSRRGDAVSVAKELEQYGINLNYVDDMGRNALSVVLERFYGFPDLGALDEDMLGMARFLAERGVTVKPSALGLDPLDGVLLAILETPLMNPAGVYYVRFLLDHGALIESSHRELVCRLRSVDPQGYQHLVSAVPELAC